MYTDGATFRRRPKCSDRIEHLTSRNRHSYSVSLMVITLVFGCLVGLAMIHLLQKILEGSFCTLLQNSFDDTPGCVDAENF